MTADHDALHALLAATSRTTAQRRAAQDEYLFEVESNRYSLEDETESKRGHGEPADANQVAISWEDFQ